MTLLMLVQKNHYSDIFHTMSGCNPEKYFYSFTFLFSSPTYKILEPNILKTKNNEINMKAKYIKI